MCRTAWSPPPPPRVQTITVRINPFEMESWKKKMEKKEVQINHVYWIFCCKKDLARIVTMQFSMHSLITKIPTSFPFSQQNATPYFYLCSTSLWLPLLSHGSKWKTVFSIEWKSMHMYIPSSVGLRVVDGQFSSSVESRHSWTPILKHTQEIIWEKKRLIIFRFIEVF